MTFYRSAVTSVRSSTLGGKGLFADRNIVEGEIVAEEEPAVLGPKLVSKTVTLFVCVGCLNITDETHDETVEQTKTDQAASDSDSNDRNKDRYK